MEQHFQARIVHLEDRVPGLAPDFIARTMRGTIGLFPPRLSPENVAGKVNAIIDDSRWIVRCPNPACAGALLAPRDTPFFCCVDCGSPENNHQWYEVVYPKEKAAIEKLLLARPYNVTLPNGQVAGRGWTLGQTAKALLLENAEIGIEA
ncbi:MAG: hypothetical protein Q8P22_05885 [Chloroflexota bacterium]|nr:hypothetical protein [Chloroflexota bacterium]